MSWPRRAKFDKQRSLAFGSIVADYAIAGTVFANAVRILLVTNATDKLLQFSTDGVNDHFVLLPNGTLSVDFTTNSPDLVPFWLPAGRGIYVKRIDTPTSGSIYVSAVYGKV